MIKDISWNEEKQASVVTLLEGFKHKYADGDQVQLKEVIGMKKVASEMELSTETINDSVTSIKVISPS